MSMTLVQRRAASGKSIPLNDEQVAAVIDMSAWINRHATMPLEGVHRLFCLRGYAGTGKTFTVTRLLESCPSLRASNVVFTAPTNKAVKVLRQYLDDNHVTSQTCTIHSLLGLQMAANGELKELTSSDFNKIDLSDVDLVVVDEASMVNRKLFKEIWNAVQRFNFLVLFMGDPAQLPPVGENSCPIWKIPQTLTLTKIMRHTNTIVDLATEVRAVVDDPEPYVDIIPREHVFVHTRREFLETILSRLDDLKTGRSKVIAWRNATVDKYNDFIREAIYGVEKAQAEPFIEGDKIVATEPGKDLYDNIIFKTDEEFVVQRAEISKHPKFPEYETYRILAKHEDGRLITLFVLTESGKFDLENKLQELASDAKNGRRELWRKFWRLKEAFHQIRSSYAITSHRSQGSTYDTVFVDRRDILANINASEAFRSLYVAVTRAKHEVHIY